MIVCIILSIIIFVLMIILCALAIKDEEIDVACGLLVIGFSIIGFLIIPFLAIDKASGQTIGIITSVDKNFWGTTAIYIKTSETEQEEYCAENKKIIEYAKENIGEKVKISYGTRIGLYSLNKCHHAPINKIEKVLDKENKEN